MKKLIILTTLYTFTAVIYAQPGRVDSSFGKYGVVKTHIGSFRNNHTSYKAIALQTDGKIVAAGNVVVKNMDLALARYNTDGSPDSTFNGNGTQVSRLPGLYSNEASAVAIQADGKIVITGYSISASLEGTLLLARFNTDGSLDSSFGGGGFNRFKLGDRTFPNSIAILNDGKIVVGGFGYFRDTARFILVRCNKTGSLDSSFADNGVQNNIIGLGGSIVVDTAGKILMAGPISTGNILARFNSNGTPDNSFSGNGIQLLNFAAEALALQHDGKIVISGKIEPGGDRIDDGIFLARYNQDGTLDSSFGNNGIQISDFGGRDYSFSIQIETDGKILIAGSVIARYSADGVLDQSFNYQKYQISGAFGTTFIRATGIMGNRLYAAGTNQTTGAGVIAAYLLNGRSTGPTIALSAPVNNATYLSGGNVYLTATASDSDGVIQKVEFYNGTKLLHTATDTPYTFKWLKVNTGNYSLTAKATDNDGLVSTSAPVRISLVPNKPPHIRLLTENYQLLLKGGTLHLVAGASDEDGRVTKVEFYNGTTLLATEHEVPYTFDWRVGKLGHYIITARATDNWGAVTTSPGIEVIVVSNQAPAVNLIKPFDGQVFTSPVQGATINLEAAAADNDGRIVQVSFYNGDSLLTSSEHKFPYTYQWQNVPAGTYTITAVAKDNWSDETVSAPVTITVKAPGEPHPVSRSSLSDIRNEISEDMSLELRPNPTGNMLNIHINGSQKNQQASMSIISSSGILMRTFQMKSSSQAMHLDISELATGMYLVKMVRGDKVTFKHFVKM